MVSKKLDAIINESVQKANHLCHEYLTLEVLFWSILTDQDVELVLRNCGGDIANLRVEIEKYLSDQSNFSILSEEVIDELSKEQFQNEEIRKIAASNGVRYQPHITESLQRVIQRAAIHVQSAGKKDITPLSLLVAIFSEENSMCVYFLAEQGIKKLDIVREIAHGIDKPVNSDSNQPQDLDQENSDQENEEENSKTSSLDEFCVNLNAQATKNKIDPLIGRESEIERIIQILLRRRKNNPLLVGEAGVGKTAIAEGLAYLIIHQKVPKNLDKTIIYSLDVASLLAGAKFRGDFEKRLKLVLRDLKYLKEKEGLDPVLFIDEIHTIMGAGATGGGSLDASNLLKPMLSNGEIKCIGSTTYDEFRKFIEKDHAFARRFQKIDIDEPSFDDTVKIMNGLKTKFEEHHAVKYSPSVVKYIVELSDRFITDKKNPDKAIDVLDEVGAMLKLSGAKSGVTVSKKDVETVVSKIARIPKLNLHQDERSKLKNLKSELQKSLFGQDGAIQIVSDAILLSRSGLGIPEKPIGSFLFTGPTGVGKTELAKKLAEILGAHLERIDMSEYMEKHSVAKLVGAPPGYVGYDQGGLLTTAVKKHPHCVLLLDEIEKAHPDVYNILLQIMDYGKLTDSQGRTTDYRNVVLIMTSNAGAKEAQTQALGLTSNIEENQIQSTHNRDKAIKNSFSPEFRNRLSAIVHFNKLQDQQILKIVEKFLYECEVLLMKKKVVMRVSVEAKSHLAKIGFDPLMGARPIQRIIDEKIKKPLSHELLFGKLEKGGEVFVDLDDKNELIFVFNA